MDEAGRRWVALDVGETIIDETRMWSAWADALAVPPLTFAAVMGAIIAGGGDYREVLERFGGPRWSEHAAEAHARFGGFRSADLYPDALHSIDALRDGGYRVAVVGNQPAVRTAELESIGVCPDLMAMSEELGADKPDPAFFERALELMGRPAPDDVAYVGDRLDNDIRPARAAGLRAVWLRRGPWGLLHEDRDGAAHLTVRTLRELVKRIAEAWSG